MELTQQERISLIKNAHLASQGFSNKFALKTQEFVEDIKTEQVVAEHGLLSHQQSDIEDEKQFLNSDIAEDIAEEDEDMGCVSDQMKGVYS